MKEQTRDRRRAAVGNPVEPEMNPGDQAPPGAAGTGENICPKCSGSGVRDDGARCEHCGGTGKVIVGVGGA
jgi:hypothetical protein